MATEPLTDIEPRKRRGPLDFIEWIGNKLPDPAMLFVIGAVVVMFASAAVEYLGWSVQPVVFRQKYEVLNDETGAPLLYDGMPRVRLIHREDGKPDLESVTDRRKIKWIRAADAEPGAPAPRAADSYPAEVDQEVGHSADPGVVPQPPTTRRAGQGGKTESGTEGAQQADSWLRDEAGRPVIVLAGENEPLEALNARSLLTRDGLYWTLDSMVDNFMGFAPLGIVLTGMLGIGVAERTGMLGAALKAFMLVVPNFLLTPTMVFLGIMSSLGTDAGYVVLPPLAAALYYSLGRSPLVGVAAVFAGVAAGFNANLLITGLDPMLSSLSTTGAQIVDPSYAVTPTCNWWFLIASTFVITFVGWLVTSLIVERRFNRKAPEDGGPAEPDPEHRMELGAHSVASGLGVFVAFVVTLLIVAGPLLWPHSPLFIAGPLYGFFAVNLSEAVPGFAALAPYADLQPALALWQCLGIAVIASAVLLPVCVYWLALGGLKREESAGLAWATFTQVLLIGGVIVLATHPEGLLYGADPNPPHFDRWVAVVVPIIFFAFLAPGIAYGITVGNLKSGKDVARLMTESMASMAPIIVLAFFAAQFIEYFRFSNLDQMTAIWGGTLLASADMPLWLLLLAFIGVTVVFNLFVGSMSAKYTMFAPIFVPMFMMADISPELTQAAYRIGDSVSNVITPLNAYLVIVLVYMQKYVPKAGIGTLISMMMPYTIVFLIVWSIMLIVWVNLGWELGLGGPLTYPN